MSKCPIMNTLTFLGKKWTLCILHQLNHNKEARFTELSKELKINPRTLSQRLTLLESEKLIGKNKQAYVLTKKGEDLISSFSTIEEWVTKYS